MNGAHNAHGAHSGAGANMMAADKMAKSPRVHQLHTVGVLRSSVEHMVMEFLQVALGKDAKAKLRGLQKSRMRFQAILRGLRHGDEALGLHAARWDRQFAALRNTEADWARFDKLAERILKAGALTSNDFDGLIHLSEALLTSLNGLGEAFEQGSGQGGFSVLNSTVRGATKTHALIHRMLTFYLLVANGHRVEDSMVRLVETHKAFEKGINGLMNGDSEQQIIAPPNAMIADRYRSAVANWKVFKTTMEFVASSGKADGGSVDRTLEQGHNLARDIEVAIGMYHAL